MTCYESTWNGMTSGDETSLCTTHAAATLQCSRRPHNVHQANSFARKRFTGFHERATAGSHTGPVRPESKRSVGCLLLRLPMARSARRRCPSAHASRSMLLFLDRRRVCTRRRFRRSVLAALAAASYGLCFWLKGKLSLVGHAGRWTNGGMSLRKTLGNVLRFAHELS